MAKTLIEAPITTPSARAKLVPGVHWRRMDADTHLGYRKGTRAGVWLVRWRDGKGYKQQRIGTTDDVVKAGNLSFSQAETAAKRYVETARIEAKALADGPAITVRSALEDYIAKRDARDSRRKGREVRSDASQRLGRFVLGKGQRGTIFPEAPFAHKPLHQLAEPDLRAWHDGLPDTLKGSSRQRLINDFKAALNDAYQANRERLPASVPEVIRHGLKSIGSDEVGEDVARDNQILSDAEIARLLRGCLQADEELGWEGDFYRLAVLLASTGARFSEVIRMHVRDIQIETRRAFIPFSFKGTRPKLGHTPVPIGQDAVEVLLPVLIRRDADDTLLERWRHKQVPGSINWEKDKRGPWQESGEYKRAWDRVREIVDRPDLDMYAFRHSSIVRGIRANLPIRLVAALHDTSVAMIEKHYSRWIVDGLEELAATAVVPLVTSAAKIIKIA